MKKLLLLLLVIGIVFVSGCQISSELGIDVTKKECSVNNIPECTCVELNETLHTMVSDYDKYTTYYDPLDFDKYFQQYLYCIKDEVGDICIETYEEMRNNPHIFSYLEYIDCILEEQNKVEEVIEIEETSSCTTNTLKGLTEKEKEDVVILIISTNSDSFKEILDYRNPSNKSLESYIYYLEECKGIK